MNNFSNLNILSIDIEMELRVGGKYRLGRKIGFVTVESSPSSFVKFNDQRILDLGASVTFTLVQTSRMPKKLQSSWNQSKAGTRSYSTNRSCTRFFKAEVGTCASALHHNLIVP
jgi:hypothetical protein